MTSRMAFRSIHPSICPRFLLRSGSRRKKSKRRNIPTVYLEVYDRIDSKTLTGRMVQRFTTEFCVQWPEQQALYEHSTLVGPLY